MTQNQKSDGPKLPNHDRYVRRGMRNPRLHRPFFKTHLPADVVADLDLEKIKAEPDEFVDQMFKSTRCDMLFSVPLKGELDPSYIYILFEHKSTPASDLCWIMLKRRILIMDWHVEQHGSTSLPMILPLVLYHGNQDPLGTLDVAERIKAPQSLEPWRISAPLYVVNLSEKADKELMKGRFLTVFHLVLKHINNPLLSAVLSGLAPNMIELAGEEDGFQFVIDILHYVFLCGSETQKGQAIEVLRALPTEVTQAMGSIADNYINDKVAEGIERGLAIELPKAVAKEVQKELSKAVAKEVEKELPKAVEKEVAKEVAKEVQKDKEKIALRLIQSGAEISLIMNVTELPEEILTELHRKSQGDT